MARVPRRRKVRPIEYPTRDGQPGRHRSIAITWRPAPDPEWLFRRRAHGLRIRVASCLLRGGRPQEADCTRRLRRAWCREAPRDHYLIWEEGQGPDLVIELTSKQRRQHDQKKFELYRDVLKVPELFLIDPSGGYFDAPLQGFRWSESGYVPIQPGRGPGLYSEVLGLNLEREGYALRLFDPDKARKLPTIREQSPRTSRCEPRSRRRGG